MNLPQPLISRARRYLGNLAQVLRHWPWINTIRTLRQRFREDHLALTASSLTFTTLISLVPLMTVMLALFTAFPIFSRFQTALQQYFFQALIPDSIARPVLTALTQFAGKASKLGSVGLIFLGVTALALMFTIDRTLNAIWRVRQPRPLAQRVLVYWAAITLGPLLLGASLSITSYLVPTLRGNAGALSGAVTFVLALIEFGLLAVGLAGLFRYVPNTHVRWSHAVAGGVFAALGFEVAKRVLAWYVKLVPTYSMIYGVFATLPILLLWVYVSWVIVLLGAVVAAYAPSLSMRVVRLPDRPGERFALALAVLKALHGARFESRRGLSMDALSGALHVDPLQVEPVLDDLQQLGWCGRLDEDGAQRHVLLIDVASTPAQPLVDALLLQDDRFSDAFRRTAGLPHMTVQQMLA